MLVKLGWYNIGKNKYKLKRKKWVEIENNNPRLVSTISLKQIRPLQVECSRLSRRLSPRIQRIKGEYVSTKLSSPQRTRTRAIWNTIKDEDARTKNRESDLF